MSMKKKRLGRNVGTYVALLAVLVVRTIPSTQKLDEFVSSDLHALVNLEI